MKLGMSMKPEEPDDGRGSSPPLGLRHPPSDRSGGSGVSASGLGPLAGRAARTVQSPQIRASDSPQVATVSVRRARLAPYVTAAAASQGPAPGPRQLYYELGVAKPLPAHLGAPQLPRNRATDPPHVATVSDRGARLAHYATAAAASQGPAPGPRQLDYELGVAEPLPAHLGAPQLPHDRTTDPPHVATVSDRGARLAHYVTAAAASQGPAPGPRELDYELGVAEPLPAHLGAPQLPHDRATDAPHVATESVHGARLAHYATAAAASQGPAPGPRQLDYELGVAEPLPAHLGAPQLPHDRDTDPPHAATVSDRGARLAHYATAAAASQGPAPGPRQLDYELGVAEPLPAHLGAPQLPHDRTTDPPHVATVSDRGARLAHYATAAAASQGPAPGPRQLDYELGVAEPLPAHLGAPQLPHDRTTDPPHVATVSDRGARLAHYATAAAASQGPAPGPRQLDYELGVAKPLPAHLGAPQLPHDRATDAPHVATVSVRGARLAHYATAAAASQGPGPGPRQLDYELGVAEPLPAHLGDPQLPHDRATDPPHVATVSDRGALLTHYATAAAASQGLAPGPRQLDYELGVAEPLPAHLGDPQLPHDRATDPSHVATVSDRGERLAHYATAAAASQGPAPGPRQLDYELGVAELLPAHLGAPQLPHDRTTDPPHVATVSDRGAHLAHYATAAAASQGPAREPRQLDYELGVAEPLPAHLGAPQLPHDRATDAPHVATVSVHGARLAHYATAAAASQGPAPGPRQLDYELGVAEPLPAHLGAPQLPHDRTTDPPHVATVSDRGARLAHYATAAAASQGPAPGPRQLYDELGVAELLPAHLGAPQLPHDHTTDPPHVATVSDRGARLAHYVTAAAASQGPAPGLRQLDYELGVAKPLPAHLGAPQLPHDRATDAPQVATLYARGARLAHYATAAAASQGPAPGPRQLDYELGVAQPPPAHLGAPQSPHNRATDPPQVATLYVPGARLAHYAAAAAGQGLAPGPSQLYDEVGSAEPPPAHLGASYHQQLMRRSVAPVRTPRLQVATRSHGSQVPPQADSLLMLLQQYPLMWQGLLVLKNYQATVQMHFLYGNPHVARDSLPCNPDGSTPPLFITQRMFLRQTQLDWILSKMQMHNEHCMLLAFPWGQDHMDVLEQSSNLQIGFITYLQQKQAAGIVNITVPGSQTPAYIVHIFTNRDFSNEILPRIAPDLHHRVSYLPHLLIVITTV